MEPIKLNESDRAILTSYEAIVNGIANFLGPESEIILHSLECFDTSVIKIANGYHTGRSIGAPITDLALEMLNNMNESEGQYFKTYFTTSKTGKLLKSATIAIKGTEDKIIGLLCINLNLDAPFKDLMKIFLPQQEEVTKRLDKEKFGLSADELIIDLIHSEIQLVNQDNSISTSNKNKQIIFNLFDKGVFNFKDAVNTVSKELNISKNTTYMHLRKKQMINKGEKI